MAMNISMSPAEVEQLSNEYMTRKNEVDEIISNMDRMLGQLMGVWQGQAAQAYEQRWQGELKPSFQNASELIGEIADAIRKSAQAFADADEAVARGLRG